MKRNVSMRRMLAACAGLLISLAGPVWAWDDMYGSGPSPQPRQQPAYRADEFMESIGLNAPPTDQLYLDLGIRYYRAAIWNTDKGRDSARDLAATFADAWEKHGVRPMLLLDSLRDKPDQTMEMIKEYPPGLVAEIEGSNEVNNKFPPQVLNTHYAGKTDEAGGAAFMDDLVRLLRADPATKDIPVVSFTAIFTDYRLAKPHTSFDFGNIHSYQGNGAPSSSLEMNITRFNNILPVGGVIKPFTPTECGYNVEADRANGTGLTGSVAAQAKSDPMIYTEYFRHGIARTYLFALHNVDGYGLLESDNKPRPSYFAIKNLVAAVNEGKWNPATKKWEGGKDFTPQALLFDLPGAPQEVHTLVLQKSSGEYDMLIWNEMENYDEKTKRDRDNPLVPVTVQFQTPVQNQATILTPNSAGEYGTTTAAITDGKLAIHVPPTVMIVRLMPASKDAAAAIAAPAGLTGTASENDAKIHWQAVPGAAGYFVFRNGWHIATTTATEYADESSWLRPGLGYTYEVQAFAASGAMSPRAAQVVQTAARFPDLIATEFGLQKPDVAAGETVRAFAKVKNIGDGATPNKIKITLSWKVDDKVIGWCTPVKVMQPGDELTLVSDGGGPNSGQWTAKDGTHILTCIVDDIDRLPGEYKGNNLSDLSFVVGEKPKGEIMGSTQSAPGTVDLSTEGTLDWVHWGLADKDSVNRKADANLLDAKLVKESEGYCDRTEGCPVSINWTGGTPTAQAKDTHTGLWWNNVGTAQSFTAPADTTERVLKVYVAGIEGAGATLTAKLSDDSAPPYVSSTWNGNAAFDWAAVPDGFSAVYTIRYHAASAGQKLTVQWKLSSEPNRFLGQARIQAATLAQGQ